MKILFLDWACFGKADVLDALKNLGHDVTLYSVEKEVRTLGFYTRYIEEAAAIIRSEQIELVFSLNYFPNVSEACEKCGCKYISWIYDSPYNKCYSINVINPCNMIFTFDRHMYTKFCRNFVQTVYYAPLSANVSRLDKIRLSATEKDKYTSDISFVGTLYDERHNNYEELLTVLKGKKKHRTIGFINALIDSQLNTYGYQFLSNVLNQNTDIMETLPDSLNDISQTSLHFTTLADSFADHILCRKIASMERREMLTALSTHFTTKLYTPNPDAKVGQCINCGYVDYKNEMPKVFKMSKINLNITLRSIRTGIPLRAMDIMGSGGFLMTNYQDDFLLHFEPDLDYVYYSSREELLEKVSYYLSHDRERKRIAENGYRKVSENHTYEIQIAHMISMAFPS
ncbi:MAG: DUF3880 domain-containing protein [Lachnoclostridium sp.]|nr:DUF3880 domain-containing protein [Lachnoclostridium sp.]